MKIKKVSEKEVKSEVKPVATGKVQTEAEKMWDQIKELPIDMFSLPNQKVWQHCTPVSIEPSKLYLITKASATLPALESSLNKKFMVEQVDRFVVVSRPAVILTK
jgi:hypothetical protein